MERLRRALREPLVHFLLLGAFLFAAWSLVSGRDALDAGERVIVVDRAKLVEFLQYRSSAFEQGYFEAQFDALSDEQVAELARTYVREEAMAREARALGLDQNDYVIRRRLIQKIEYLVTDTDLSPDPPTEEELRAYFAEHGEDFRQVAQLTFTHVFADAEQAHSSGIDAYARGLLAQLRGAGAGFNDAPQYGDRFPYQRNFVSADPQMVADIFGPRFTAQLMEMEPGDEWQGPVTSSFGEHLVMLTANKPARDPEFAEVRDQVLSAVLQQRKESSREALLDELVDQYDVRYEGIAPPKAGQGQ